MPVVLHRLDSRVLRGNPLGDPTERDLAVYLPPGFDPARRYPALLMLAGFMADGPAHLMNQDPLGESLVKRLDRLIGARRCPPMIVAAPDCFSRVGGSQYLNSPAVGRHEDYVMGEVLPFVARTYRVSRWGVFGKSSGGYGSLLLAMRHPGTFRAVAAHSPDCGFELAYLPWMSEALDRFREAGGPSGWLKAFWKDPNRHRPAQNAPLNILGMAAFYSPNPRSPHLGIEFPLDLETGAFRSRVWARWRAWDPVHLAGRHPGSLRKLRLLFFDCGNRDECRFHWGCRALAGALRAHRVPFRYEPFDDGHLAIAYRYDQSLPLLGRALSG
jgi:hypothetical protein